MTEFAPRFLDLHYHAGVDLYVRRHTTREAARRYAEQGGWVVVKSHLGSTAAQAWEARQEGLPVSGSVVLNAFAGGLDTRVVEHAVCQHGTDSPLRLLVYLPTMVGAHPSRLHREPFHPGLAATAQQPLQITDDSRVLRPEVLEVLRAARDLPVTVATGHADRTATLQVIDAALEIGLDRLLLTHPTHPASGLTVADLRQLAEVKQVHIELTALTRLLGHHSSTVFDEILLAHPRVIYSSDLGQPDQPDVEQWLEQSGEWFRDAGLDNATIARITRDTAWELMSDQSVALPTAGVRGKGI